MSVLKFQQDEETCDCPTCKLINEYTGFILDADTKEEVEDLIVEVVNIAKEFGIRYALEANIHNNIQALKSLDGECDCEECSCED